MTPTKIPNTWVSTRHCLLTIQDVAERLQVSQRTVRRLIKIGKLKVFYVGRSVRVSEEALQSCLTGEGQP
jgi:excisionase family DNA binding protein